MTNEQLDELEAKASPDDRELIALYRRYYENSQRLLRRMEREAITLLAGAIEGFPPPPQHVLWLVQQARELELEKR